MGIFQQDPLRYRGRLDGSNSATAFASVTGTRWVLTGGHIGWANISVSAMFTLKETWDSASSVFFRYNVSTTNGCDSFYLGPVGIQASEPYSGLMVDIDDTTACGSYSIAFTGYRTGG
jgi:hypothetical protein